MSRKILTRRALMLYAGFAALFFQRVFFAAEHGSARQPVLVGARRLQSVFLRAHSARTLGKAYLRLAPEEADPFLLVNSICETDRDLRRILLQGDDRRLRVAVQNCSRRDFANGQTVILDGWMLSRTEVRLCALALVT